MHLDVRIPAGMMFSIIGSILTAFGLSTHNRADIYMRSMGIDANLWWGLVLLIFGMMALSLGRKGQGVIEREREKKGNREK